MYIAFVSVTYYSCLLYTSLQLISLKKKKVLDSSTICFKILKFRVRFQSIKILRKYGIFYFFLKVSADPTLGTTGLNYILGKVCTRPSSQHKIKRSSEHHRHMTSSYPTWNSRTENERKQTWYLSDRRLNTVVILHQLQVRNTYYGYSYYNYRQLQGTQSISPTIRWGET